MRAAWARALSATILRSGPFMAQRVARSCTGSFLAGLPPSATIRAADSMTRAGTQSSAKPRRFAFFASTLLPVSIRSSAAAGPIRFGRRSMPPQPGTMPSMTSGSASLVPGSSTTMR